MGVEQETQEALAAIRRDFRVEFELMDEVLAYVQGLLTRGKLMITKPRGLDDGIVTLVATILTKACKTFRATRAAVFEGCGQDASILLRALFESTIALLYILQRDSRKRAILYAAHEDQRKLVMVEMMANAPGQKRAVSKATRLKAQAKVAQWSALVGAAEVAAVRKHWAGPGGLETATKKLGRRSGWHRAYNSMYRYLSAFSHGSDANAHLFVSKVTGAPVLKLLPGSEELDRVPPMACMLLLVMSGRFDERLGLGNEQHIKALKDKSAAHARTRAAQRMQP
jgi:Family of unknown function (DUF5677)